jgi:hypothetical protein
MTWVGTWKNEYGSLLKIIADTRNQWPQWGPIIPDKPCDDGSLATEPKLHQ